MIAKHALRRTLHALATPPSEIPTFPSTISDNFPHHLLRLLPKCKNLRTLLQIHGRLIVSGHKLHNSTATHLVNSYSSFHKCDFSRSVFDFVQNPSVILWNSMIRAYARSKQFEEALKMYRFMLEKGVEPDKHTYTFVLKACTGAKDFQEGVLVHSEVVRKGLECDVFIGTGLVDLYCKTGHLDCAREVFEKMHDRDVVAWNAMIAGLSQSEDPSEALGFFRRMQLSIVELNSVSLLNLVPAVSKLGDIDTCRLIHAYVIRRDFQSEVSNGLIDMYSKCGDVEGARRVFDRMWGRDDISWGTMMVGYAHNRSFLEVLELFDSMREEDLKMNKVSVVSALLAAAEIEDLQKGKEIHDCAIQQGIDSDVSVATPIMTMYVKCGKLQKAKQLFEGLQARDLVAWSAVISAFVQSGHPEEAVSLFREMQYENLKPNNVTLMSVLPACAELSSLRLGKSVHCYTVKADIDSDIFIGTALVSMYAKCGFFSPALVVFNRMPCKDIVTWNALINGYSQIGDPFHAMDMFQKLRTSGVQPDSGTMVGLVPACALLNDLDQGTCIHGHIIKSGYESDTHVINALIDMYAKCGSLSLAEFLFNRANFTKDEVSWNVIIGGYMQSGNAEEAISAFHLMKLENFHPNLVTFISILPAAAYLAALREGMAFHACIIQLGFPSNTLVGNCLIDMYAKCGQLSYAEKCFIEMGKKNTVSCNAMLAGYASHGQGVRAINLFSFMQDNHVQVDSVSFICVLSACRHAGLIEEGRNFFHSMHEKHHIEPGLEHYACVVDMLGRAGLFDETLRLIEKMPMEPDAGVWGALLGACKMHSNLKLGEVALDHLAKLEPANMANYVALSGIYAQSGKWGDAGNTKLKMNETGLKKTPGCSWIEAEDRVHEFQVGYQSHP